MKQCTKCGETKPLSAFSVRHYKSGNTGHVSACRKCCYGLYANKAKRREYSLAAYARNPEKARAVALAYARKDWERHLQRAREWKKANPEKRAEHGARRRARERGAPIVEKIDRAAIYERDGGRCHVCRRAVAPDDYHLDHLIPLSKGGPHTPTNLAVAHPFCNMSRHDGRLPAQLLLVG